MLSEKLELLGLSLIDSSSSLTDNQLVELVEAFEEQQLAASHFARLKDFAGSREGGAPSSSAPSASADEPMKLVCKQLVITADEHRCSPGTAHVAVGSRVRIAVSSGPPQSFEITNSATQDSDDTPRIPAGEHYDWEPAVSGAHTITSHIYPGCKARVVVQPAAQQQRQPPANGTANGFAAGSGGGSSSGGMSQVDEHIRLPLRTSRGAQTDPMPSTTSRFTSTDATTHLPPLRAPASSAASVLPGITSAAAAAVAASSLFGASPEELEVFSQTGLRRRASASSATSSRPGSAASIGATSVGPRSATPDAVLGAAVNGREGSSSNSSSQGSPRTSPTARVTQPIFRPVRAGSLHRSLSPGSVHSADETMPLLDIRMNNRVQHRTSSVFPTTPVTSAGALVSPTSVAGRDATHKCPRCRKEFLSTINQRRCLAVHLGHKAGAGAGAGSKGAKGGTMPDRAQLVEFWDALPLGDKRALVNIRAEPGGESVCRNMEIRLLQRPAPAQQALSTEQRNMVTAGRTLFEVLVRGKGLESLSGEALATLLSKASEGTFLYDRALPARGESYGESYNAEAGLSAFIGKRLVEALLKHRQEAAERAQRELEELEEAQKGDKGKQAESKGKKKQQDGKKSKPKSKQKAGPAKPAAKPAAGDLSRSSSGSSEASGEAGEEGPSSEDAEAAGPAVEDSAQLAARAAKTGAAAAGAAAAQVTPAKPAAGRSASSSMDLTPPPTNPRYTPPDGERPPARRPNSVTFTNMLYRSEGEDAAAGGSWQPAGKSSNRSQQVAAATRPAAAVPMGARPGVTGNSQQSAAMAAAGKGVVRAVPAKPAARPPAQAAQAQQPEEAFPALPSKAASKADSQAAPAAPVAAGPAPGLSYAAAAKAARQQQQAAAAAAATAAAAGGPQQEQQEGAEREPEAAAGAAVSEKAPPPLPVVPGSQQPLATPADSTASGSGVPAASSQETSAAAPQEQPQDAVAAAAVEPAAASEPAAPASSSAAEGPSVREQPAANDAAVEQPPAAEAMVAGAGGSTVEPLQPELDEGVERAGQQEQQPATAAAAGQTPIEAPYAVPPHYAYPLPPVPPGYFYYPGPHMVPSVQFGDVDIDEILQKQQQQQQAFFAGYPAPLPFAAMPPYPPHMGVPAHVMPPGMEQAGPAADVAAAPAAAGAALAMEQEQQQNEGVAAAAGAAEQSTEAAPSAEAAPEAEAAQEVEAAVSATQLQPGSGAMLLSAMQAARPWQPAASTMGAQQGRGFDAQAAARELAVRWRVAMAPAPVATPAPARAQQGGPQPQTQQQQQQQQRPQGFSRSSSGSDVSGGGSWRGRSSPAGHDRQWAGTAGGAGRGSWAGAQRARQTPPKSEWRPVSKEQQPESRAALDAGNSPHAAVWASKAAAAALAPRAPPAAPAAAAPQRLSFAAVASGAAKAANGVSAGGTVRGWSSEEGGEGKWRIQAAKRGS